MPTEGTLAGGRGGGRKWLFFFKCTISFCWALLWNSSKPRGDEDKHNINASRVFRLCPLRRKRHNTRSALAIPQSQTFKDVHLVPCSGFSVKVFFFKRRERERKKKITLSEQNPTNRAEPTQLPRKERGIKGLELSHLHNLTINPPIHHCPVRVRLRRLRFTQT